MKRKGRKEEEKQTRKKLPRTSSFSGPARAWKSGHYSTKLLYLPVLRPVSTLVRQRIRVHASVAEVSGNFPALYVKVALPEVDSGQFHGFLRALGLWQSSVRSVLAHGSQEYWIYWEKTSGLFFLRAVTCLVSPRLWSTENLIFWETTSGISTSPWYLAVNCSVRCCPPEKVRVAAFSGR